MKRTGLYSAVRLAGLAAALIAAATLGATDAKADGGAPAAHPRTALRVTAPEGFETLTQPQQVSVDVYMNGNRAGEALAFVQGGKFRFIDAHKVVDSLPEISDTCACDCGSVECRPRSRMARPSASLEP